MQPSTATIESKLTSCKLSHCILSRTVDYIKIFVITLSSPVSQQLWSIPKIVIMKILKICKNSRPYFCSEDISSLETEIIAVLGNLRGNTLTSNSLAYLRNTSTSLVVFIRYKTGMGTTVKCLLWNWKSTSKGVAPGAFLLGEAPEP